MAFRFRDSRPRIALPKLGISAFCRMDWRGTFPTEAPKPLTRTVTAMRLQTIREPSVKPIEVTGALATRGYRQTSLAQDIALPWQGAAGVLPT